MSKNNWKIWCQFYSAGLIFKYGIFWNEINFYKKNYQGQKN